LPDSNSAMDGQPTTGRTGSPVGITSIGASGDLRASVSGRGDNPPEKAPRAPMTGRVARWVTMYLRIAAVLLVLAALSKVMSVWKPSAYLSTANPVLSVLSNRQVFRAVALLELVVAGAILSGWLELWTQVQWVFWLGLQFAVYRLILLLAKEPEPCKCFGDLFLWLGLGPVFVDWFSKVSLVYFLAPSGVLLLVRAIPPGTTPSHEAVRA